MVQPLLVASIDASRGVMVLSAPTDIVSSNGRWVGNCAIFAVPLSFDSDRWKLKFLPFSKVQEKFDNDILLDSVILNHPGGSTGYKFTEKNISLIYLCDNEFEGSQRKTLPQLL